jgi:uncharacterized protein YbjT (DUF2867 family)
MNVILFGATGMVGQGVLRECLLDPDVQRVETVGRTATSAQHAKLREVVRQDIWHYAPIEDDLSGFDACFFCLGVSSAGMTEADYERVTFGITMAAAEILSRLNPNMTFIYVSGAGMTARNADRRCGRGSKARRRTRSRRMACDRRRRRIASSIR